jgi:hypothetical protein
MIRGATAKASKQFINFKNAEIHGFNFNISLISIFLQFWFHQLVYLFSDHTSAFRVILLSRVFLGACQGVHFPAMASISSRNLSTKDRAFFFSFTTAGSKIKKYRSECFLSIYSVTILIRF